MTGTEPYAREYLRQYAEGSFELVLIATRRKHVLASVRKYPHQHILEVGCGVEPYFPFLDNYQTYTIVEPSDEFVRVARSRAEDHAGANVFVVHGRLEDSLEQLAGRAPFDFIIISSVLHEVPDPSGLLQAARRLATAATTIHINVPNVYSFHRLLALEMGLIGSVFEPSATERRFQRHTRFDRLALLALLEEHKFDVLHFETYLIKPFSNDQMERLVKSGVVDARAIDAFDAMTKYLPEMGCEMLVEVKTR
jgi:SAM-dependent methyltransferase